MLEHVQVDEQRGAGPPGVVNAASYQALPLYEAAAQ